MVTYKIYFHTKDGVYWGRLINSDLYTLIAYTKKYKNLFAFEVEEK